MISAFFVAFFVAFFLVALDRNSDPEIFQVIHIAQYIKSVLYTHTVRTRGAPIMLWPIIGPPIIVAK